MNGPKRSTSLVEYLKWSSQPRRADEIVQTTEYRLLCSGELKPANLYGDWGKSDGARLLLREPLELIVVSRPFDDYPQEIVLRLPTRWEKDHDTPLIAELTASADPLVP